MADGGKVEVRVTADTADFNRGMGQVEGRMSSIGSTMGRLGKTAALALGAGLAGAAVASIKAFADFEQQLNTFEAVSQATGDQMQRVGQLAKELGADITLPGTSAKDAAKAMTELAKGGLSVEDAMDAAKGTLQLAAAAEVEVGDAATITADALNAFNLEGKDAGRVADILANAANATTAEMTDMADALKMSSAVAHQLGVPIEDLTALLGLMANAGIKGSDAGTSVKQMLLSLAAPTDKAAGLMEDLGIKVFDAEGKFRGMEKVIGSFEGALKGMTDEQKAATLATIFGSDAVRAAAIIFGEGTEQFRKMRDELTRQGAAAELAAAKMKGIKGAIEAAKSVAETAAITFGSILAPGVMVLAGAATEALQWLDGLFQKIAEADGAKAKLQVVIDAFRDLGESIINGLRDKLSAVDWGQVAQTVGDGLKTALGKVGKFLADINWGNVAEAILKGIGEAIKLAWKGLTGIIQGIDWSNVGQMIGTQVRNVLSSIGKWIGNVDWGSVARSIVSGLADAIRAAFGLLTGIWKGLLDPLIQPAINAGTAIRDGFLSGIRAITGMATAIWDGVKAAFGDAISWILERLASFISGLGDVAEKLDALDVVLKGDPFGGLAESLEGVEGKLHSMADTMDAVGQRVPAAATRMVAPTLAEIQRMADGMVQKTGEAATGIQGKAGQFTAAGTAVGRAAAEGAKGGIAPMVQQTGTTVQNAIAAVTGKVGNMRSAGRNVGNAGKEGTNTGLRPVVQQTGQTISQARSAAAGYQGAFRSTGVSLGAGLKSGVLAGLAGLIAEVAATVQAAVAAAAAAAQIRSPSKKMHEIGYMMTLGLEHGFADRATVFLQRVHEFVRRVIAAVQPIRDLGDALSGRAGPGLPNPAHTNKPLPPIFDPSSPEFNTAAQAQWIWQNGSGFNMASLQPPPVSPAGGGFDLGGLQPPPPPTVNVWVDGQQVAAAVETRAARKGYRNPTIYSSGLVRA
jgi:TP901 family phage tail tape measure protein